MSWDEPMIEEFVRCIFEKDSDRKARKEARVVEDCANARYRPLLSQHVKSIKRRVAHSRMLTGLMESFEQ